MDVEQWDWVYEVICLRDQSLRVWKLRLGSKRRDEHRAIRDL